MIMSMDGPQIPRRISSTRDHPATTSYVSARASPTTFTSQAWEDDANQRDSVASLKDDPFFRNYQTPHSVSLSRELRSARMEESAETVNLPV